MIICVLTVSRLLTVTKRHELLCSIVIHLDLVLSPHFLRPLSVPYATMNVLPTSSFELPFRFGLGP